MNSNSTPYPSFVVISPQATCKLVLLTKLPCFDGSRATTSLKKARLFIKTGKRFLYMLLKKLEKQEFKMVIITIVVITIIMILIRFYI